MYNQPAPTRQLTLFDSTCIIVGIIVGAGIYESSPLIAQGVSSPAWLLAMWLAGGLISLIGGLCYAELATAYPHEGGDYVYLTRAYGREMGFLFAWAQLWIVRPGSIGAMAFIFARYANEIVPLAPGPRGLLLYAAASIVVLTTINLLGVALGKWTQNLLTVVKVLGLGAIVVVGLTVQPAAAAAAPVAPPTAGGFYLALIMVLFAYGGWSEMAYVAAEVRRPQRNILRALVLGTLAVTAIYALVSWAFVKALGFSGLQQSGAVAADVLDMALPGWGRRLMSVLVAVSALGAMNGNIFTGARIFYAMGVDHPLYGMMGRWSGRFGTPLWALVVQGAVSLALVVAFGRSEGGFSRMVVFTTPVFWAFLVLVGLAVFVLRLQKPDASELYQTPLFPLLPILFCLSSSFMVYASLEYAVSNRSWEALWAIGVLLAGVLLARLPAGAPAGRTERSGHCQ